MKILIVDDEEMIRGVLKEYVEFEGNEAFEASDGMEAVRMCKDNDYDVVLMDIMMPGIDGLEATRRIRALDREDAVTTPIIAVSANAFADDRRLSREAGMDAHLSKPVSSQELVEALAHIAADAL